jgi:hypothetical protein
MRILHTLVIALTALGAVSCANDEKELFSLPAAERIDQVVKKDRAALEASPNGWKFDYFLGRSYSGPGVAMMVTFRNGKATMASDASDTAVFYTADYDVVKDQGPVLTFNTFLAPIHSLAGGMASFPEGRQGDYEFSILSTSADTIRLRGKKWGNEMMLTRNPIGLKQDSVIMGAIKMRENMITDSIYLCHGKDTIPGAAFDLDNRHLDINGDVQLSSPLVFTPKGFILAKPLTYKGQVYGDFTWNDSARTFIDRDMTISFRIPETYKPQSFWIGKWSVKHRALRQLGRRPTYLTIYNERSVRNPQALRAVLEFNRTEYEIFVMYNRTTGTISIPAQTIEDPTKAHYAILFVGTNGSQLLGKVDVPFTFQWDPDFEHATAVGATFEKSKATGMYGIGYKDELHQNTDAEGNPVTPIILLDLEYLRRVQ